MQVAHILDGGTRVAILLALPTKLNFLHFNDKYIYSA